MHFGREWFTRFLQTIQLILRKMVQDFTSVNNVALIQRGIIMKFFINEEQRKNSHSTCYLEFQKGYYQDVCWLNTSISINDVLWDEYQVSKLILEVVPEFDFYGLTVITKEQWDSIVMKSQKEGCICKEIIAEAIPWATKCFETNDVFTILGI